MPDSTDDSPKARRRKAIRSSGWAAIMAAGGAAEIRSALTLEWRRGAGGLELPRCGGGAWACKFPLPNPIPATRSLQGTQGDKTLPLILAVTQRTGQACLHCPESPIHLWTPLSSFIDAASAFSAVFAAHYYCKQQCDEGWS